MKKHLLLLATLISAVVNAQTGTTLSGSFTSGGKTRTYTYYVPAMYNGSTAVPLVFNIHGLTGSSEEQEDYMDYRTIADTANFIVVHPEGLNQSPIQLVSLLGWGSMTTPSAAQADMDFLIALLDTLEAKYNIDTKRVYSSGYSQGGFMSYNLACHYSSRFAAVASTCASLSVANMTASNVIHPTPIMEIHGTTDNTIAYSGNTTYMHIDTLIARWACLNNCNPTPTIDTLPDINTADNCRPVHYVFDGGYNGSTVELYKVIGGGHQVPSDVTTPNAYGVGNRNMDFKATKVIWEFFRKYSLNTLTATPDVSCFKSAPVTNTVVPTSIQESIPNDVSVYPNPTNGLISFLSPPNSIIKITNMIGNVLAEIKANSTVTRVDLSGFSEGIYFYLIQDLNGKSASGKIVLQ